MNRRSIVQASLVASSSLLLPSVTGAQQATPEVEAEPQHISDFVNLRGVERVVVRNAVASSSSFESMFSGDLYFVACWGFEFSREANAKVVHAQIAHGYSDWMTEVLGNRVIDLSESSARQMGDESWGWVATIIAEDEESDREYAWALFAMRIETTVQILAGVAASGSPIRRLADIAEKTEGRWPNDERRRTVNSEPAGGIWDTLPVLDDFEEGTVIEDTYDDTRSYQ